MSRARSSTKESLDREENPCGAISQQSEGPGLLRVGQAGVDYPNSHKDTVVNDCVSLVTSAETHLPGVEGAQRQESHIRDLGASNCRAAAVP